MRRIFVAAVLGLVATAATAAPAGAATTFDGECSIDGKAHFGLPLHFEPQMMDWGFTSNPGGGRCTGTLNRVPVVNAPIDVVVRARGPISCGVAGSSINADFEATFPTAVGSRSMFGRLSLAAVAAQNVLYVEGKQSGFAVGRASFFGQNDQVAVLQGCADGNTIRSLNVNVTVRTAGPMSG